MTTDAQWTWSNSAIFLSEPPAGPGVSAVVMAGGYGARLRPLTNEIPKPMLPLSDKPVVEHIIDRLRSYGVQQVYMATHYKAEAFSNHFGDGRAFGVQIDYIQEEEPRGTAVGHWPRFPRATTLYW